MRAPDTLTLAERREFSKLSQAERALFLDLLAAEESERARRSEAAQRGAETRRAHKAEKEARPRRGGLPPRRHVEAPERSSSQHRARDEAARVGHARKKRRARLRARYIVNTEDEGFTPSEEQPRMTGETAVVIYDMTHPDHGDVDAVALWHGRLRQFYGHRVKLVANGERRDEDGNKNSRIYIARVGQVVQYADVFGNDGLYYRVMKAIFEADSDGEVVITSLTFELADEGDRDGEGEGEG